MYWKNSVVDKMTALCTFPSWRSPDNSINYKSAWRSWYSTSSSPHSYLVLLSSTHFSLNSRQLQAKSSCPRWALSWREMQLHKSYQNPILVGGVSHSLGKLLVLLPSTRLTMISGFHCQKSSDQWESQRNNDNISQ